MNLLFPADRCGFSVPLSPVSLRNQVHPLVSSTSLSKYVAAFHLPKVRKQRAPSMGFCFPSRHPCAESTKQRASQAHLCSALSVSHTLDGLLLLALCGLVSSHCHVRNSHFRGFPYCQADSTHRRIVPSCRFANIPSRQVALPVPEPNATPSGG
jgi:hypothetical protein